MNSRYDGCTKDANIFMHTQLLNFWTSSVTLLPAGVLDWVTTGVELHLPLIIQGQ